MGYKAAKEQTETGLGSNMAELKKYSASTEAKGNQAKSTQIHADQVQNKAKLE